MKKGTLMKRKVAAFANAWSDEYLMTALEGIRKCAVETDIDVYFFVNYSSNDRKDENVQGEVNILNLPKLKDYDGVFLLGNTLNNAGELDILRTRVLKEDIPAVCLEYEVEGIDCICTDNYSGMYELCEHVLTEHDIKRVVYVAGMMENQENKERLRALRDALKKHKLSLAEEDIIHGEWSFYAVQQILPDWLEQHQLPDVFICANDVMAMGTIAVLTKLGYIVPKDVYVTGFDNVASSRTYLPSLTTVDREWEQRSYIGFQHLIELMDGKQRTGITTYPSKAAIRESCGCEVSEEIRTQQFEEINRIYMVPTERTLFDWHLSGLDEATTGISNLQEIHDGLASFFERARTRYEGATFCICLDESFVASIYEQTEPSCLEYSEQMHVLYARRDCKTLPYQKIKTSYIFPVFSSPEEKGNLYIIAPLHNMSASIGYVVFKNQIDVLDTFYLYSWLRHLKSGLMRSRQNIIMENMNQRLKELSIMDELSGLMNRKGYERKGIPLLEQIKKEEKSALMMVVDINQMKVINDRYGHLQGDLAIRLVAKAIKETIPSNWCGIRYGGDEFLVIGENVFVDDGSIIKKQLCKAVESEAKALMLPFKLSVSVGSVIMDPKNDVALDEYFSLADNAMYEMKKRAHMETDEEKNTDDVVF